MEIREARVPSHPSMNKLSLALLQTLNRLVIVFLAFTFGNSSWASDSTADMKSTSSGVPMAAEFERDVYPRLVLPPAEVSAYTGRLQNALDAAHRTVTAEQFIVLVDRSSVDIRNRSMTGATKTMPLASGRAPTQTDGTALMATISHRIR